MPEFNPKTMKYVAPIIYFRFQAIIACDGKCYLNPKDANQLFLKICTDPKEFPTRYCARNCPRSFLSQPFEDLSQYKSYISVISIHLVIFWIDINENPKKSKELIKEIFSINVMNDHNMDILRQLSIHLLIDNLSDFPLKEMEKLNNQDNKEKILRIDREEPRYLCIE